MWQKFIVYNVQAVYVKNIFLSVKAINCNMVLTQDSENYCNFFNHFSMTRTGQGRLSLRSFVKWWLTRWVLSMTRIWSGTYSLQSEKNIFKIRIWLRFPPNPSPHTKFPYTFREREQFLELFKIQVDENILFR